MRSAADGEATPACRLGSSPRAAAKAGGAGVEAQARQGKPGPEQPQPQPQPHTPAHSGAAVAAGCGQQNSHGVGGKPRQRNGDAGSRACRRRPRGTRAAAAAAAVAAAASRRVVVAAAMPVSYEQLLPAGPQRRTNVGSACRGGRAALIDCGGVVCKEVRNTAHLENPHKSDRARPAKLKRPRIGSHHPSGARGAMPCDVRAEIPAALAGDVPCRSGGGAARAAESRVAAVRLGGGWSSTVVFELKSCPAVGKILPLRSSPERNPVFLL